LFRWDNLTEGFFRRTNAHHASNRDSEPDHRLPPAYFKLFHVQKMDSCNKRVAALGYHELVT